MIARADGVKPEEMHVTLAHLGIAEEMGPRAVSKAVAAIGKLAKNAKPLVGAIGGQGRFNASPTSDGKDVLYASLDVPGLAELRQDVIDALDGAGLKASTDHGFTPHVTLDYVDPSSNARTKGVPTVPVRFDAITVAAGDEHHEFPLGAGKPMANKQSSERPMKSEEDGKHPASDYAHVPDPTKPSTWQLRIDDAHHVGGAAAALGKGYRGNKVEIPAKDRAAVVAKVRAAWKKFHPDAEDDEMPEGIRASEDEGEDNANQRRSAKRRQPTDDEAPGEEEDQTDDDGDTDNEMGERRKKSAEPTGRSVHINVPVGEDRTPPKKRTPDPMGVLDEDEEDQDDEDDEEEGSEKPAEKPSRNFLTRLRELLKSKVRPEEYDEAVKAARAHAGGKARSGRKASDPMMAYGAPNYPDTDDDNGAYLAGSGAGDDDADDGAQPKYEKADPRIKYRKATNPDEMCMGCRNFDCDSGMCRLVEGAIGPKMTCNLFAAVVTPLSYTEAIESLKFAAAPTWIPFLPKPGTYSHPQYGKINLSPARLARFIENFKDAVYQKPIPLDAEHETKLSGAVGWIKQLRQASDGSVDARIEWTDRGRTFLEANRFKFVSPEWYDEWTDPATGKTYKDVVIGGALTTRPFFKEGSLRPLAAKEAGTVRTWLPMHTAKGDQGMAVDAQRFAEMESQVKKLSEERERQATELKQAAEKIAAMERKERRQRFSEIVQGHGSPDGIPWTGDSEKRVSFLEKLADKFGEDSEEFREYVTEQNAAAEQIRTSALFREMGRAGGGGTQSFAERVDSAAREKLAANPKLDEADAQALVFAEHPDWYDRYRAEVSVKV